MSDTAADPARGGAQAHLDEWTQFFRDGGVFTVPVDQKLLSRRLAGNQAGLMLISIAIVVVVAGTIDALKGGSVTVAVAVVLGVLALTLALAARRLWTTRQRLGAARVSPHYLTISRSGVQVVEVIELPWELSIGLVVLSGRGVEGSGKQRLGASAARGSGIAQTEVIIGLGPGVAKPLRAAAGKRLRRLWEVIGDGGALRVPLDSVLSPTSTAQVISAVQAAASLGGVGAVGPTDPVAATVALQGLYLGTPLRAERQAERARVATAAAVASTAAAALASISAPYAAAAALFARALARATPSGLAVKGAALAVQDPAQPLPVATPSAATPVAVLPIDALAGAVLSSEGRTFFDDARRYLAECGPEAFAERYPDLDDGFSDDGPAAIDILLGAGQLAHARTIGWCDWSGEDDPGQVLAFIEQSCRTLWQSVPFWSADTADAGSVGEVLRRADEELSGAGQRILMIDNDSDTYYFVPVKRPVFEAIAGRVGEGFRLTGVDER